MAVDVRHQVFVSSTFTDLREERSEVSKMLQSLDCIVTGMEGFPASDQSAKELIQNLIKECDYYVVIVGGRYGSVDEEGISYTELEYDWAVEAAVPVLAFLFKDPGSIAADKSEMTQEGQARLAAFRAKCEERVCRYWTTGAELAGQVAQSLTQARKSHPRPGWVRAGQAGDPQVVADLREEIESLREKLVDVRMGPPPGTENLAGGSETVSVDISVDYYGKKEEVTEVTFSWDEVFERIGPELLGETTEASLNAAIRNFLMHGIDLAGKRSVAMNPPDVIQSVKFQLNALGMIAVSDRKRSVRDVATYWALTPWGTTRLTQLRAIKKGQPIKKGEDY